MVTSNKLPDKKVVRMAEQNNSAVVPQRTLLGEVNEHITCPICRGYYIDATTIVECLHSFCRSCIIKHLQVKSYCPVCEMMINSAKPNIKLDKALQDIVYKLVPGLFQREMERRQQFYASRPGTAAAATPEQRGEDTERIIFSPEDVISFSLEYADVTDTDSVSSKSSDASNEAQPTSATSRRYLQCPAVVNISHLKKFLSMKFNIDCSQFAVDILYKRVPLPDYYTLMDIAYIYNWKRNEPMRFFYQIIDYVAIRNRLFDVNRKGSHFEDEKMAGNDSASSPTPNLQDHGSEETSSGTDSPMLKDNQSKHSSSVNDRSDSNQANRSIETPRVINKNDNLKPDEEVEKSQFLNSFELTAKSNSSSKSTSPVKSTIQEKTNLSSESANKTLVEASKDLKRKQLSPQSATEMKKLKIEIEKANVSNHLSTTIPGTSTNNLKASKELKTKLEVSESTLKSVPSQSSISGNVTLKDTAKNSLSMKPQHLESSGIKRSMTSVPNTSLPKKKPDSNVQSAALPQKTISPLKLQLPKPEPQHQRPGDAVVKPHAKKMPDLKPSVANSQSMVQNKLPVPKIRMDLLANNSDPTIDRSKILSQVKSTLGTPPALPTPGTGDPLRSLFDSCKINIPSSLSITLTDQKLESRNPIETATPDTKKNTVNKNFSAVNASTHKVPSPPVHNYIEILKIPESDAKKQNKVESNTEQKVPPTKPELTTAQTKQNKQSETSAKGPVPNLKPISDTKHGKASGNYSSSPITFQQTFEQQLQSLQSDKKPKLPKTKAQVPKLVPATPKTFTAAVNKLNQNKPNPSGPSTTDLKPNIALDLSTAPNIQQSKAFETMQSIANLAKKQGLTPKAQSGAQNNYSAIPPRPINTTSDSARLPLTINQIKLDKMSPNVMQSSNGRQDASNKPMQLKPAVSPSILSSPIHGFQPIPLSNNSSPSQPSPRSQTRSPSCSPKLVIAEEKQPTTPSEPNMNQSNHISSTQQGAPPPKSDSPKVSAGPSKPAVKSLKPVPPANKISGIRQPITPTMNPVLNPTIDYLSQPQLMAHHALLRHQMEMQTAWLKARHDLLKNMTNIAHQSQNDFNNKDKQ